ncbi:MAG: hypothetical protein CMB77_07885 [Euryarchaeota archaeon]|nr:hypothetical protein [Euryarchaeota archaeon]
MMPIHGFVLLIPLLPMLAFPVILILGQFFNDKNWWRNGLKEGGWIAVVALGISLIFTVLLMSEVWSFEPQREYLPDEGHITYTWLEHTRMVEHSDGSFTLEDRPAISFGFMIDHLSMTILFVASFLCFLIGWFSLGYMNTDAINTGRLHRFYAEFALFSSAMMGMVLADSFLWLFIFWEIMGLCSYLLIGFYYERPSAASAAKKAFLTTRVGDVFLLIGLLMLFDQFGTLSYDRMAEVLENNGASLSVGVIRAALLLLFVGAVGKSAQFPLHVWLPDAMEGPTPVSALIHAATMVNAGLYLVARMFPIVDIGAHGLPGLEIVGIVVAWIGGITALMAAAIAFVQMDLKRVLAYSTMSQLAYIFVGLGVGLWAANTGHEELALLAFGAAIFHLFNHAMAKAMLFMASGSVIHEMHHAHHHIADDDDHDDFDAQSMENMGGLGSKMPVTTIAMAIGSASIIGLPLIGGFWSKEGIIGAAWESLLESGGLVMLVPAVLVVLTAAMTGFYMTRMWAWTFLGHPRSKVAEHVKETTPFVRLPLQVLTVVTLLGIVLFGIGMNSTMIEGMVSDHGHGGHHYGFADTIIGGLTGHGTAYGAIVAWTTIFLSSIIGPLYALRIYGRPLPQDEYLPNSFRLISPLLTNRSHYDNSKWANSKVADALRRRLYFDEVYDWAVMRFITGGAMLAAVFDKRAIDGLIRKMSSTTLRASDFMKSLTTGRATDYLVMVGLGVMALGLLLIPGSI